MSTPTIEVAGPRPEYQEQAAFIFDTGKASDFIRRMGLLDDVVLQAWEYGYGRSRLPDGTIDPLSITERQYKIKCISHMLDLEDTHPGGVEAVTVLNQINNFGRVPLSMLRNQCDNTSKKANRVVTVLCSSEDNNGAHAYSLAKLEQLRQTLPRDTAMVLMEVHSARSLDQLSFRLESFGTDVQTDIIYTVGHGDSQGTTLGAGHEPLSRLNDRTLRNYFSPLMRRIGHPATSHVLISCRTAAGQNSFASQLHAITGHRVLAPYKSVCVRNLQVADINNGVLVPGISYYRIVPLHKRAWQALPTKTRVFERKLH